MKPLGNPVFRQSSGFRQILHVLHASMAWRTPKWSPSPIGAARAAATRAAAPLPAKSANFHTKLSQLQWQLPEASVHARHLLNLFWTVKELFFWDVDAVNAPLFQGPHHGPTSISARALKSGPDPNPNPHDMSWHVVTCCDLVYHMFFLMFSGYLRFFNVSTMHLTYHPDRFLADQKYHILEAGRKTSYYNLSHRISYNYTQYTHIYIYIYTHIHISYIYIYIIYIYIYTYHIYIHIIYKHLLTWQISCEPAPGGLLKRPHHHRLDGHGAAGDLRALDDDLDRWENGGNQWKNMS